MWIANAERSQEMDRLAQSEFGIKCSDLMERAGLAVFEIVQELLPEGGAITVFCGKGNNGGDGLVVARLAAGEFKVDCLIAAHENELCDNARFQLQIAVEHRITPIFRDNPLWATKLDSLKKQDLIVDGLLGTGAKGEVQGTVLQAIQAINQSAVPVVAIDVPSGIDCDTGEELGASVRAVRTITFGLPKPFLFQGLGMEQAGSWTVADIGFPSALLMEPTDARLLECACLPKRKVSSHKGNNGTVLTVAGSHRMRGAAALAAMAAQRAGAGLVTVAAIESVCEAVMALVPEATLIPLPENNGVISADAARLVLERRGQFDAALFGPGLTTEDPVAEFLERVWREWDCPCCIDADGLNCIALGLKPPAGSCVLTPHPGEMARLLHTSVAAVQADRFKTIKFAQEKYGKTLLLKGPHSLVANTDKPPAVNSTGNRGMATAGMGDVLSGVITTLLAQGLSAYDAASSGMFWHGFAGDLCAASVGPIGFTASEVAAALPEARAKIMATCEGFSS